MSKPVFCRLEQLAHLRLPTQTFIPAILQELHHIIPSIANTFCWQDENDDLSNIYDEMANTEVYDAFVRSISSQTSDKYSHTIEWVSKLDSPTTSFDNFGKCPFIAEFYNTIMLPAGYMNTCFVPVFHNTTHKRLGVIMVHRPKNAKRFSKTEQKDLQAIAMIIAHGIEHASQETTAMTDGWSQGLLITNQAGELQYSCSMGSKLLAFASTSQFSEQQRNTDNLHIFNNFQDLIDNIINQGKHSQQDEPPILNMSNAWGQFQLKGTRPSLKFKARK
ncbi:MAG: hypothetical protein PSN44_09190 [Gammaproteobacteria bacterium]|nr:hypothetical protein [Gammaproteobacteria bacterium]